MKSTKKYLFLSIIIFVLLLPIVGLAQDEEEVKIGDKNFKNALREMCGVEQGEELYVSDVEKLSGDIDLSDREIENASGIRYLVNAKSINLSYNKISEIRGDFSGLTKLESLDLSNNDLYNKNNIYIEDIPNLKHLDISANKMTYLVELFAKLTHLETLDISANRMTDLSIALLDFDLKRLNCDYNFFDLTTGSKDREILDKLHEKGCEIHACKQLVKLPQISYYTENGNLVVKWNEMYDVPFYDESKAEVVGYTILLDSKFIKSVTRDTTFYTINNVDSGKTHTLSVSADYNVNEYDDFKIRSYTIVDNVTVGKSGPKMEDENAQPTKHANYYDGTAVVSDTTTDDTSTDSSSQEEPVLTYDEAKAKEEENKQSSDEQAAIDAQETFSNQPQDKSSNLIVLISLLAVIIILITIISILLIKLWRNKNLVGRDEIDFED